MLQRLSLKNFTVFDDISMDFVPGINVIIGENGTGKTHLMKVAYSVLRPSGGASVKARTKQIASKLLGVFGPGKGQLGSLARRPIANDTEIDVRIHDYEGDSTFLATLDYKSKKNFKVTDAPQFQSFSRQPTFLPTKEVISFIHSIVTQYDLEESPIDDTYSDLCHDLDNEAPQFEELNERAQWSLERIKELCNGEFVYEHGQVAFKAANKELYTNRMIAEGHRKLGVLYRLLENGTISPSVGGPLFWDEPDANLNPSLLRLVVGILFELARNGQQVIVSTHNYVFLKEVELARRQKELVRYHTLRHDRETSSVTSEASDAYADVGPNAISETYSSLYDRDLEKDLGGIGR